MLNLILYPLMAACVAIAGPTRRAEASSPPTLTANAFTLVANVTGDQSKVFSPPIGTSSWTLGSSRIGANRRVGVLGNGAGHVFFANGTDAEVSSQKGSIGLPPQPLTQGDGTIYYLPSGMTFGDNGANASIQMNFNPGTQGAGIVSGQGSPWAQLFTPYGQGPFHACNISDVLFGNQQYSVLIPIGDAAKTVPDNCVSIRLLPQCAVLPDMPGAEDVGIVVAPVQCYQNVSAIDWKLYSS